MNDTVTILVGIAGPLLATALGSFLGLRGALNSLKDTARDIKATTQEVRDIAHDTHVDVQQVLVALRARA